MTTAIIADDEPLLRAELCEALADLWPELEIVAQAADGASALRLIEELKPTVSFLDIRMPKLTGLELAERIQGDCQIVFVTAFDEHAIAAFEQGAADYLLKPVRQARLAATVQRLKDRIASDAESQGEPGGASLERIQATIGNTLRFFPVSEVCYCRSDGKYTRVVTADAEALIRRSLTELTARLDARRFWRINRGIIVNLDFIDRVVREEGNQMSVHLRHNLGVLPVSAAHQSRFRGM